MITVCYTLMIKNNIKEGDLGIAYKYNTFSSYHLLFVIDILEQYLLIN